MAECGHCKDCKWWEAYTSKWVRESGWGECCRVQESGQVTLSPSTYENLRGDKLPVTMETKADSGCFQYEPKEPPHPH